MFFSKKKGNDDNDVIIEVKKFLESIVILEGDIWNLAPSKLKYSKYGYNVFDTLVEDIVKFIIYLTPYERTIINFTFNEKAFIYKILNILKPYTSTKNNILYPDYRLDDKTIDEYLYSFKLRYNENPGAFINFNKYLSSVLYFKEYDRKYYNKRKNENFSLLTEEYIKIINNVGSYYIKCDEQYYENRKKRYEASKKRYLSEIKSLKQELNIIPYDEECDDDDEEQC